MALSDDYGLNSFRANFSQIGAAIDYLDTAKQDQAANLDQIGGLSLSANQIIIKNSGGTALEASSIASAVNRITISTWAPVITGSGTITISATTIDDQHYVQLGPFVFVKTHVRFTISGTGAYLYMTVPVSSTNYDDTDSQYICFARQAGTQTQAFMRFDGGTGKFLISKHDQSNWTTGANASIGICGYCYRA